ncbi:hypothetical protein [uncultured Tolumonas sp.]|uniref:hypothetical protein n=2 Tax=uncultured Tolumonas sp. TaxID=263765 RepID=UPI002A0A14C4|nr:hypothetical protein [uncultured Tolumonas sp.]
MFRLFFPFIFLSLMFSATASASLASVPARETWSLATDDVISINQAARTATGRVYLAASDGVLFRATATTTADALLGVAETSLTGGKGNPWLTAALAAAGLSYEAYKWYKTTKSEEKIPFGTCYSDVFTPNTTYDQCVALIEKLYSSRKAVINGKTYYFVFTDVVPIDSLPSDGVTLSYIRLVAHYKYPALQTGAADVSFIPASNSFSWTITKYDNFTVSDKKELTDQQVGDVLLGLLTGSESSRQAFGENSQPYPLAGLFPDTGLNVDPTYSPSADVNPNTLPDYITKYNNGLLQTTDPSKPNYVTPAQYEYIKSQAESQAAAKATGASGATSTNPLQGMEQPITQDQYDASNKKVDDAAKSAVNSQSFDGFGDNKTLDDGNQKLKEISEGGIQPLSPFNLPSLPQASTCQSVTWEFMGQSVEIPGADGCKRLADLKRIFGYLLYVLTAIAIIWKATEKPLE